MLTGCLEVGVDCEETVVFGVGLMRCRNVGGILVGVWDELCTYYFHDASLFQNQKFLLFLQMLMLMENEA